MSKSQSANLYLNLQVDQASAPELGEAYVASREVDKRDKISDLNRTLNTVQGVNRQVNGVTNTVNDTRNTIRGGQNIFRF